MSREKTAALDQSKWHEAFEDDSGYILADRCGRDLRLKLTANSKTAKVHVRLSPDGKVIDRQVMSIGGEVLPEDDPRYLKAIKRKSTVNDELAAAAAAAGDAQ